MSDIKDNLANLTEDKCKIVPKSPVLEALEKYRLEWYPERTEKTKPLSPVQDGFVGLDIVP